MVMDKARNYGAMNTTSRVGVSFGTRLRETFNEEVTNIIEACVIEDEIATDNGVRTEVATNMTSTSDGVETFPTPILETSAVSPESPRETRDARPSPTWLNANAEEDRPN